MNRKSDNPEPAMTVALRDVVAEASRRATNAQRAERQVMDMAVGMLIDRGASVLAARRAVGVPLRVGLYESLRTTTQKVLRKIRSRNLDQYILVPSGKTEKTDLDAVREVWAAAELTTSVWSRSEFIGLSRELMVRHSIPTPASLRDARSDTSAAEFINHATGERILVYSLERWCGALRPEPPAAADEMDRWDYRGTYRIERVSPDGQRTAIDPTTLGLPAGVERFGGGWSPPAHAEDDAFERICRAIRVTYDIIPDAFTADWTRPNWRRRRLTPFGPPDTRNSKAATASRLQLQEDPPPPGWLPASG